jgi:hypothetical protein
LLDNAGNGLYTGDGTSGIFLWGAQIETGSTATAYQKVVTAFEVTEVGVPTCHYCAYAGANSMATPSIDFTATDKMSVFAGVRKLSDVAAGIIAELGTTGTVAGGFKIGTSTTAGDASRRTWLVGQGNGATEITAGVGVYPSPDNRVLTGLFDRAGSTSQTELQMRLNGVAQTLTYSSVDLVTGNYANLPLYLGRRNNATVPFTGRDYGIIIVGKSASSVEINNAEAFLANNTPSVTL